MVNSYQFLIFYTKFSKFLLIETKTKKNSKSLLIVEDMTSIGLYLKFLCILTNRLIRASQQQLQKYFKNPHLIQTFVYFLLNNQNQQTFCSNFVIASVLLLTQIQDSFAVAVGLHVHKLNGISLLTTALHTDAFFRSQRDINRHHCWFLEHWNRQKSLTHI